MDESEYDPNCPNVYDDIVQRREDVAIAPTNLPPGTPSDFAVSLLMKMGWSAGEGLGSRGQGIVAPLVHQKAMNQQTAVVRQAEPMNFTRIKLSGPPSQRVSLFNVCLPAVSEGGPLGTGMTVQLEDELIEEASRCGNLVSVNVKKYPTAVAPADRVEIICEYETLSDATRALAHLNKRSFNDRIIEAVFTSS